MKIDVFFTPEGFDDDYLREKHAVVIDILRASSTIITALQNGAKEIIPCVDIVEARAIAQTLSEERALLCGERQGKIIDGFDLGNSPEEYTAEVVSGKTLIFCTTNGTRAILRAKAAKTVLVGAFINLSILKEFLVRPENIEYNLAIICAGKENRFSLEDALCAGLLVDKLLADKKAQVMSLSDSAMAARILYEKFRGNELAALKESEHGRYLTTIGFAKDIEFAAKLDVTQALPILEENVLRLHKLETKKFKRVD